MGFCIPRIGIVHGAKLSPLCDSKPNPTVAAKLNKKTSNPHWRKTNEASVRNNSFLCGCVTCSAADRGMGPGIDNGKHCRRCARRERSGSPWCIDKRDE